MKKIIPACTAFLLAVTGCGGGGGASHVLPASNLGSVAANPAQNAQAQLTIAIPPSRVTAHSARRPRYVASATNSLSFTAGGTSTVVPLTATSPSCTAMPNGSRSCTASVSAPVGPSVTFSVSTYASADGTGAPLSATRVTKAIVANQVNQLALTMDAVVSKLEVVLSKQAFTIGQADSADVAVNVLDAAGGTIIIGTDNLADANDNPVTVSLSESDASSTQLSSSTLGSDPTVLSYNGVTPAVSSVTISAAARASSGSLASASSAVTFASQGSGPAAQITYDAARACINHVAYTNDVLPSNVGEFRTSGLNRAYWGGTQTRTVGVNAGTWAGFQTSWGRHQYETYFSDSSDGLGLDPFAVVADTAAPGSPTALRISAMPVPPSLTNSLTLLANDQWQVSAASAPFAVPTEGGSLTIPVVNPNGAQNGWKVGMGYNGGAVTFIGTLSSGGATPSGTGGGSSPWTISNIHIYSGTPGTTITPGVNDEGGLRSYHFPAYVAGSLDTNVNLQYGFFASRIRLPNYLPALSPAFWTLETGGVVNGPYGLQRDELDIMEMFGATSGNSLNAGNILWNSGKYAPTPTGVYPFPNGTPQADYHDYGALITPQGTTFYLDGKPIDGPHTNTPDWTQGSPDKEIMLMFQVGGPGGWLDPGSGGMSNSWPQYMWSQWIRVYRPTANPC